MAPRDVYLVSAVRTPVGRAGRGGLASARPDDLAALVIGAALDAAGPGGALPKDAVGDVVFGCSFPEGEQGFNVARMAALAAGLPDSAAGFVVNRFCASGLQAIACAHDAVAAGRADVAVGGGVESMSRVPMGGATFLPNPSLAASRPESYWGMGLTAEAVAAAHDVSREDQDAVALRSHQRAVAAWKEGRFADEVVPVPLGGGRSFDADDGPRPDTSAEALAALPPAFKRGGTVTAGNSSQVSDGAAAAVLASGDAVTRFGLRPLARLASFAVTGVSPGLMGLGPATAVPAALAAAGVPAGEVGLYECNEAFAAQWLAVIRLLDVDPAIVNVSGGAIALGHPLGCTGARSAATLLHEMRRRGARYGVCTMCVGGGMGAAAVFESAT